MKPSGESAKSTPQSAVRDQSVTFDALNVGAMVNGLDSDLESTAAIITAEERAAHQQQLIHDAAKNKRRMVKYAVMGILLLMAIGVAALRHGSGNQALNIQADASQRFPVTSIPLTTLSTKDTSLVVGNAQTLSINGQLNVNNSLVIAPTTQPSGAVTGQLYYNQANNQLAYYNGKSFQSILSGNDVVTTTVGGASGAIGTGSGLSITGKTLSNSGVLTVGGASGNITAGNGVSVKGGALNNTGVLSLQGESGNVTLAAGSGIVVSGTTLSNSGLLSLGGQHGDIAVGDGLAIDNGTLHNTGIISATGAGLITVTNDGNGNITIDGPSGGGSGSGTVASPGGTINKLAKFTGVQTIADSIISDNGTTVTIGGNLSVSGAVTFSAPLAVANGGTGAINATGARTNLSAASSGGNSDITSLTGLTTALSVAQGGTGIGTLPTNGVLLGNGTSAISGVTAAGTGLCLVSTAGAPTFQSCPGSGGVASVNSLNGALTLTGASAGSITSAGNTITINDATSGTKGLASFNATNLTVTAGNVNTVQDIAVTATPTFGQLTLTSSQAAGTMLTVNNTNAGTTGNLLNLELNGASKLSVSPAGNLTLSGTVNGQTIGNASSFTGGVTVGGTLTVNTISPTSALTVGVGSQAFTLQGNASSALKATSGANTTTVDFQAPTANVSYNFATAVAGSYDICTTVGNCAGVGGGVTTPGGSTNTLAKFTGSGTIGNSIITDNGSTVTIGGTLSVNTLTPTGALTVGANSQNLTLQGAAVSLKDTSGGITNSLVFATPATSNKTITLPNASGTVAVSASGPLSLDASGNLTCPTCLTGGGGGGAGVSSLNSQAGALTLQGVNASSITTVGSTITINDATSGVKGLASFNATNLTVTAGNVNTVQDIAVSSTPTFAGLNLTSALTVGNGGTGSNSAAGARTNLGAAASGGNSDITSLSGLTTALSVLQGGTGATSLTANGVLVGNGTSPVTSVAGTNGQCLMVVSGTPAFGTCPGAGGGGVTTLDALAGVLTINNSTGSGSAVTINNAVADGATKGIAAFNGTNFTAASGVINTIQDINTGASPTFNGLTLSTALTVGNGGTGSATAAGARTNLGVAKNGANNDITSLTGLTTALSVSQGGTGLTALTANELLFANSTSSVSQLAIGAAGQCLLSNGAGLAPSFQTCTGAGGVSSLDGQTGSITLANSSGSLGTVTINNAVADGATKGIAAFNSTDFKATSGVVDTIQGIAATSTPTFAGLSLSTALTVANGGTGLSTLTADGILYASSSSAISQLNLGTSGQCLISNGAGLAPSWQTCPGGGGITGSGTSGKLALFNGTSTLTASDITDTAGSNVSIGSGVSLTTQGPALFKNASNSSTAFQIQDSSANNLIAVDTSSDILNLGSTGSTALASTVNIASSSSSSNIQTVNIGSSGDTSNTVTLNGGTGASAITLNGNVTVSSGKTLTVVSNEVVGTLAGTTLTVGSNSVPNAKLNVNTGSTVAFRSYQAGTFDVGQFAETGTGVGTVTTNATTNVVGSNTLFTQYYQIGDAMLIGTQLRTVSSITDDTHLAVGVAYTSSTGGQSYYRGVTGAGTLTTNGTAAIVGTGTSFTTTFQVGDSIMINGESIVGTIVSITDNTHLTLFAAASTSASGLSYARSGYDRLDIKANGNIGIGTNSPTAALAIQPNGVGQTGLLIQAANGQTASLLNIQDNSSNSILSVSTSGTDTVNIGATGSTAVASTINIGTSTSSAQTIILGSKASTSTTTIQGGSGGVLINTADSSVAFQVQDHLSNNLLAVDTSGDNVNIGATGSNTLSTTINIGTSTNNPQAIAIGSTAGSSFTTIQGGSGGISVSASSGNSVNIGTLNSNNITIGKFSGTNPILIQSNGISQTIQGLTANPASDIIKTSSNSVSAFQVQNSSGYSIFNVDTSGNLITLGNNTSIVGHGIAGSLALADGSNDNEIVTLNVASLSRNYSLSLPGNGATGTQCLQSTSGSSSSTTVLTFGTCGGVGSTTLQQAYTASAGASPSIDMTSANKGFTVQNDNASPISGELFGVHDKIASGLGSTLFSVANNGDITANSSETTGTGGAFAYSANSVSSGNGLVVNANGLTTGNGVNIATTSALQTAGSLLNVSDTAALATNGGTVSGSLINVSRSLTANTGSGGGVPTFDNSKEANTSSSGVSSTWTNFFTDGTNSNRYLIVGDADFFCNQPTTVVYGGATMTLLGQNTNNTTGCVFFYGLVAPATGSNSLQITPSASSDVMQVFMSSWYNVNQTTPFGSFSTSSSNSSSSASLNASSASGQVVVDFLGGPTTGNGSATPSGTLIGFNNTNSVGVDMETGQSYTTAAGSTTSMSWSSLPASKWSESAIGLNGTTTSETVSSAVASFSNSCTITTGSCSDSTNVLSLNQQYGSANGAVLGIQNSGGGFGLQIQNGSSASALTVTTTNLTGIDSTTRSTAAVLTLGTISGGDSIAAEGAVASSLGDYAEYFPQAVPGQLQPGDVVCLNSAGSAERCNATNTASNLIGVVSTAPGFVGNNQIYDASHPQNFALVSMLGQVPAHVSDANGAIHVGDMLTYDTATGLAVKATGASMTIGEALQDFSSGTGTIQLYIHIGYYDPMGLQSDGVSNGYVLQGASATLSALKVDGTATISTLNVTGNATIGSLTVTTTLSTAGITINGHIVTAGATPTFTASTAAGTGSSVSVTGNDESGKVTITLGSGTTAGDLANLTFAKAYDAAPNVILSAGDGNAAKLQQFVTPTTAGFSVNTATANGLTTGQTYTFYYHVMQ